MKTLIASIGSAALAAVIAAFVVLAVDDGGTTVIQEAPAAVAAISTTESELVDQATSQPIAAAPTEEAAQVSEPEGIPALAQLLDDFTPTEIFKNVGPSVVSVETSTGGGTGFFVDTAGHVVTNYHVIAGASQVAIVDADGVRTPGQVLGFDRANDLAVIKIDPSGLDIIPVVVGNSDLSQVGEPVVAIGTPFGLEQTLTTGVVSAIERTRQSLELNGRPQRGLIQTDAAINPGNSGGVLVNAAGEVIGITNSVESPIRGSVGVGFAIPSNVLTRFLPDMIAGLDVAHPWLGIRGGPGNGDAGLAIAAVVAGAPAAEAGLRAGDSLLELDGAVLGDFEELAVGLDARSVGEVVSFTVERGGNVLTVNVELGAWPG
jgi:putative serine protease PepD